MAITWFKKEDGSGTASIYPTNITLNKAVSKKLTDFYAVRLGIDEKEKKVIIRFYDRNEALNQNQNEIFILSSALTYTRISSTEFVRCLSETMKTDFSKGSRKYRCSYSESSHEVIIDLNKEVR